MTRANFIRIRVSGDRRGYHLRDLWWGIPPVSGRLGPVHLHKLGVIHVAPEGFLHGGKICPKAIRGQLDSSVSVDAGPKRTGETMGRRRVPLAHQECRDQLALEIEGHEDVLIAKLRVVPLIFFEALLLLPAKGPDFVGLDQAAVEALHALGQDRLAPAPDFDQEPQDRIPVNPAHALGTADGIAFHEGGQNSQLLFRPEYVHRPCLSLARAVCSDRLGNHLSGLRCLGGTATPEPRQRFRGFLFYTQYMLARVRSQDKNECLPEKVFDYACPRMYIAI